jgi:predicted AAA+ superfamily ATPase
MQNRYLYPFVLADLREKMVFLGGPRQVGKTTFSFKFLKEGSEKHPAYLNWDVPQVQNRLRRGDLPVESGVLVLDEIHKYQKWRNLVKGLYDTHKSDLQILVTGSARLDYYRHGGDSLQGRYHYYRLHPFSLLELGKNPNQDDLRHLLTFGGFPEPLFKANQTVWRRWQRERLTRVIHEDLVSLEAVKMIEHLKLLANALPERVGSPLSVKNLSQDLDVSFATAENWLQILENLYYCYRIKPFGVKHLRAAKKEKKLYLWDWSLCENSGAKFENFVASHLLKYCHFQEDTLGHTMELRFLRDSEGREIDFIVVKDGKPLFAVECKSGEKSLSPHIAYFSARTNIPRFYQVHLGKQQGFVKNCRARIVPFLEFVKVLEV